jgi:hypothetical protein
MLAAGKAIDPYWNMFQQHFTTGFNPTPSSLNPEQKSPKPEPSTINSEPSTIRPKP